MTPPLPDPHRGRPVPQGHAVKLLAAVSAIALLASSVAAQPPALPQPAPMSPPIAQPRDVPYPGVIRLEVDATDLDRRIISVRETIPVSGPGPITLLYPQWLPGNHAPRGPIAAVGGLTVTAGGRPVEWVRDQVNVYAFHLDVPAGARELQVQFQYLSPTAGDQGRVVVTPEMLNLQWNAVAFYPAGYYARQIQVEPSVRLPQGWGFGTGLRPVDRPAGREPVRFQSVSFDTLIDSPIYAGRYFRRIDLDPGGRSSVTLDLVADSPDNLVISDAQIAAHRELVRQADRLFGARHYDHYNFLLSLSDRLGGNGLEHHRSSENGVDPDYFTRWGELAHERDLLPHEYTHSWNGKYRRGADLWTANYDVPMRNSLLWVYEGQTQYWGQVLSARSGLWTREQALDSLARTAATYDARVARGWRALQDTTNDPIANSRRPQPWVSYQRSEDYYSEGLLVWLEVDTRIRELSGGRRSLDDFARRFFGMNDGDFSELTYTFDDVAATLNEVQPYDWATYLRQRLNEHARGAPLEGLTRGGYRLVYTDTPTEFMRNQMSDAHNADFTYSIGFVVGRENVLSQVQWGGPAYNAGLTVGTTIVAVNGIAYETSEMRNAIRNAQSSRDPIELIVRQGERYRTVRVDYHGGLRYPRLERIPGTPDRLADILAPRAS